MRLWSLGKSKKTLRGQTSRLETQGRADIVFPVQGPMAGILLPAPCGHSVF